MYFMSIFAKRKLYNLQNYITKILKYINKIAKIQCEPNKMYLSDIHRE